MGELQKLLDQVFEDDPGDDVEEHNTDPDLMRNAIEDDAASRKADVSVCVGGYVWVGGWVWRGGVEGVCALILIHACYCCTCRSGAKSMTETK